MGFNSGFKRLNMLRTLRFSLQNAVYFIILPFLLHVLFTSYIQGVLKFKFKTLVPKSFNKFVSNRSYIIFRTMYHVINTQFRLLAFMLRPV